MADKKISQLPAATLPLAGTELLPIVQSGTTDNITVNNLAVGNIKSNATTGVLQVTGPAAASTRVMTTPDANFTAARTDASQVFTNTQRVAGPTGTGINVETTGNANGDTTFLGLGYCTDLAGPGTKTQSIRTSAAGANHDMSFSTVKSGTMNEGARLTADQLFLLGYTTSVASGTRLQVNSNIYTAGNLVIGTSGKGIDFSATSGIGSSELFSDYEEGLWTPVPTNLTVVGTPTYTGFYRKIGSLVFVFMTVKSTTSTASTANSTYFSGLPYAPTQNAVAAAVNQTNLASYGNGLIDVSSTIYTPTWSSTANQVVVISGCYIAS